MLQMRAARSGQPTALLAGVWLHSRYDPEAEARRWALQCRGPTDSPPPSTVLLLGAGLGHLGRALSAAMPAAPLLAVYYHSALHDAAADSPPGPARRWHPGSREGLPEFLRRHVGELEAEGLMVVEWPPSARACPELSLQANRAVAQLLKELRGSLATTAALGRRWLSNSFRNFVALEAAAWPPRLAVDRPLLIAASGPSLERSLPLLRAHRRRLCLWALPSAAPALQAADLQPDLVVLTDPGYYAVLHLHRALPAGTPLCMPLSAGTGVWRVGARVSYISQGTVFERQLLTAAGYRAPTVLPSGTVSASALELALRCAAGPVVFAGLDFQFRDVHTHARPHTAEELLRLRQSRLRPLLGLLLDHALRQCSPPQLDHTPARGSRALDTYAGWFDRLRLPAHRPVFRLFPSGVPLAGLPGLGQEGLLELLSAYCPAASHPAPPAAPSSCRAVTAPEPALPVRSVRRSEALRILHGWAAQVEGAARGLSAAGPSALETALKGLLGDPPLLEILYHCDGARLAELRRRLRLQGAAAAVPQARELLEGAGAFLAELAARIEGGP